MERHQLACLLSLAVFGLRGMKTFGMWGGARREAQERLDWQFLLRERREPSTSEQREGCFGTPASSCAPRAQDANASKRLPICARMIVEEQAHAGRTSACRKRL